MRYGMLERVGFELELENMSQRDIGAALDNSPVNIAHDGSIETDVLAFNGSYVARDPMLEVLNLSAPVTIGAEVVTSPLLLNNVDGILDVLSKIIESARDYGESEESYRSSLHIHISMPYGVKIFRQEVRLGRAYEDLFFRLGGMGYIHRGMKVNDFAYCRPITKCGPPVVKTATGDYAQCFDCDLLEKTQDTDEFMAQFGDSRGDRYVPQRYVWLNPYAHMVHDTLEFRVFNKCLNPMWIVSVMKLCENFCKRALMESYSECSYEEHSAFTPRDTEGLHKALEEFDLESQYRNILHYIIDKTPEVVVPEGLIFTHLRSYSNPWRHAPKYGYEAVNPRRVRQIQVQDIHTLRGER